MVTTGGFHLGPLSKVEKAKQAWESKGILERLWISIRSHKYSWIRDTIDRGDYD